MFPIIPLNKFDHKNSTFLVSFKKIRIYIYNCNQNQNKFIQNLEHIKLRHFIQLDWISSEKLNIIMIWKLNLHPTKIEFLLIIQNRRFVVQVILMLDL